MSAMSTPNRPRKLQEQQTSPSTPLQKYFSRRTSTLSQIPELPTADDFVGMYSTWGVIWGVLFMTVPLSYVYIALVLLRELCRSYPVLLQHYLPSVFERVVLFMDMRSSRIIEYWCWLEALFFILMKLKIKWLQMKDPLEASLSAAPLLELEERRVLWIRMMECEVDDPVGFITGWFFDCDIESITKYDVRDFCAWSMFEGRHQEHLTTSELRQLEDFVEEAEYRISLQLYGEAEDREEASSSVLSSPSQSTNASDVLKDSKKPSRSRKPPRTGREPDTPPWRASLPRPKTSTLAVSCFSASLSFSVTFEDTHQPTFLD
jgi:hypothetical protein